MNNAEYHADRTAISKSGLDLIHKSPAHFRWAQDNDQKDTRTLKIGALTHLLTLEPHRFDDEYVEQPESVDSLPLPDNVILLPDHIKARRGKEWEAFQRDNEGARILVPSEVEKVKREHFAESVGNRVLLTPGQLTEARAIAVAVRSNPAALKIIENATAIEQSVFAEDFATGVKIKCRPDIRIGNRLYDLKTTRNANARRFAYSVRTYRYHVQAAFYMDVCQAAGIEVEHFGFIAVDTEAMPYQCTVFHRLSAESIEQGRAEYREDLELYRQCLERDEWPGYPNEYDELDMGGSAYDTTEMKEAA